MSRQLDKQLLRKISEAGILRVLGNVPRHMRRDAAQVYANAAYRQLKHPEGDPNPAARPSHPFVVSWIVDQYQKMTATVELPPIPAGVSSMEPSAPAEKSTDV